MTSVPSKAIIDSVILFATKYKLAMLDVDGQRFFSIISNADDGLLSRYICYFCDGNWPIVASLGRESKPARGVLAVEIEYAWNAQQVTTHLEDVIMRQQPSWKDRAK
jgi:hypothetical protein